MEFSEEKSQEQAALIGSIAMQIIMLDVEHCRKVVSDMRKQISKEASMSVLNLAYSPAKAQVFSKQAEALEHLCNYVDALKQVEQLKKFVQSEALGRDEIAKLFM